MLEIQQHDLGPLLNSFTEGICYLVNALVARHEGTLSIKSAGIPGKAVLLL